MGMKSSPLFLEDGNSHLHKNDALSTNKTYFLPERANECDKLPDLFLGQNALPADHGSAIPAG